MERDSSWSRQLKDKAVELLKKKGASLNGDDPNAVRKTLDKDKILKRVEKAQESSPVLLRKENSENKLSTPSTPKSTKQIVLGREVDDDDLKKLMATKSKHQHEVEEVSFRMKRR